MDNFDKRIFGLLQGNVRISFSEIGREVHLTSPAVAERVRKLLVGGVISKFTMEIDTRKLGYDFEALITLSVRNFSDIESWLNCRPEVISVHQTTGVHNIVMHLALVNVDHLQSILKSLSLFSEPQSSVVLNKFGGGRNVPHSDTVIW